MTNEQNGSLSALAIAESYVRRGWSVVPIPLKEKKPRLLAWQSLRLTPEELPAHFSMPCNIGVILGDASGGLVDIDLDHPMAVALAPQYLPPTAAVFGRAGKPQSHWAYRIDSHATTKQFKTADKTMIVEFRANGGAQTVFPGSVHSSGERIEWCSNGEPADADAQVLLASADALYRETCRRTGLTPKQNGQSSATTGSPRPANAKDIERARQYIAKIPGAVSGQGGHPTTFHVACVLVLGFNLNRKQAIEVLVEWK
jgi:hypothetical protein